MTVDVVLAPNLLIEIMRCPACHHLENRVLESRSAEGGQSVRRRRECLKCGHRFTTYERIEFAPLVVLKQSGDRETFDREKLLREVIWAFERTAVPASEIETLVSTVEAELQQRSNREIKSQEISELVLQHLRSLSEVAYIRYASVHCEFENLESFLHTLNHASESTDSATASNSSTDPAFVSAQS